MQTKMFHRIPKHPDLPSTDASLVYFLHVRRPEALLELHGEDPRARLLPQHPRHDAVQPRASEVRRGGLGVPSLVLEVELLGQLGRELLADPPQVEGLEQALPGGHGDAHREQVARARLPQPPVLHLDGELPPGLLAPGRVHLRGEGRGTAASGKRGRAPDGRPRASVRTSGLTCARDAEANGAAAKSSYRSSGAAPRSSFTTWQTSA